MIVKIHALLVPSLGQHMINLGRINKRGGVEFSLNKNGVPTLTRGGEIWSNVKTMHNGLMLFSSRVLLHASNDVALRG